MKIKMRAPVDADVAADILFLSDRTCCVCQIRGRPVQIHHVDEDPSNNDPDNLAVLCLECHHDTQLRGGFDRKLDAAQIVRFRKDWFTRVRSRRDRADALASVQRAAITSNMDSVDVRSAPRATNELVPYLWTLPDIKREALKRAQPQWDTGQNATMMQASYDVVDVYESILATLAEWYPANHFGNRSARQYVSELVARLFEWHRARLEPGGPETGGRIVSILAGGAVMADLERLIKELVSGVCDNHELVAGWMTHWDSAR